jgi:hypothetical protein
MPKNSDPRQGKQFSISDRRKQATPRKDSATGFNRQCRKCRIYIPIKKEDRTEDQNEKIRQVWRNRHYKSGNKDTARRALRNAVKNGKIDK